MKLSIITSNRADVLDVEAIEADCDLDPIERRIRIVFGETTLFIQAGDVPELMEALQKAHRAALMMLSTSERESLLRSIETDN